MKKLMIAAAAAAMIGGAQAAECVTAKVLVDVDPCTGEKTYDEVTGSGTAHKVAISLKTTGLKKIKAKNECSDCVYYRDQNTVKINGLIWEQGTDCECVLLGANTAFWTKDRVVEITDSPIAIGRIGKGKYNSAEDAYDSNKIEAYGMLNGADFGTLVWAGFGSLAGTAEKTNPCGDVTGCSQYVKSISGGIAGKLVPVEAGACADICEDIEYTGCCDLEALDMTAAYGTIKISYDKATAKKVAVAQDPDDITSFYKLPKAVLASAEEDGINPGVAEVSDDVVIEE